MKIIPNEDYSLALCDNIIINLSCNALGLVNVKVLRGKITFLSFNNVGNFEKR